MLTRIIIRGFSKKWVEITTQQSLLNQAAKQPEKTEPDEQIQPAKPTQWNEPTDQPKQDRPPKPNDPKESMEPTKLAEKPGSVDSPELCI